MKTLLHDLIWVLPTSLVFGLALSLLGPGIWWIGWLAYFFISVLGLLAISALWRSAGSRAMLLVILLLAVFLRLGLGMAFSYILPVYGNDSPVQKAGYPTRDSFSYDNEAWKLASSEDPLWQAFNPEYKSQNQFNDQYGGLLFLHSLVYRFLSSDAQRPWLLVMLSALASALGVALAWKGAQKKWGESVAWILAWIMALYPESLLAGSIAIREPFLILFSSMVFWGMVNWLADHRRPAWAWMVGGTLGMFLFSPGTAVAVIFTLVIWAWLGQLDRHIKWWWFAVTGVAMILAVFLLGEIAGGALQVPGGPLSNLVDFIRYSVKYEAYLTWHNSGWADYIFTSLPEALHIPLIIAYGITQPVLPAAIFAPGVWPMRVLGILRGLGWYALLPVLVYSLRPIIKTTNKQERTAFLWLFLVVWGWILLASARAGGDQWDNPRYRLIMFIFQGGMAAYALNWARQNHDPWLWRFLAAEGVYLLFFGEWYFNRYIESIGSLPFGIMVVFIVGISMLIFVGGWVWDRMHENRVGR